MTLNHYELEQVKAIKEWKSEEPGVISLAMSTVTAPVTWLMQKLVPEAAIRGILDGANAAAEWLADTQDIIRDAKVTKIPDMKSKDLETCDRLANECHNWAIGIAATEGGAVGATGLIGLAVDIPAIITLALRTIHKIGLCYGFEAESERDNHFVLGILSASGANSQAEKVVALGMLKQIQVAIARTTWKSMAQKAAQQQISKEGAIITVRALAKQLGVNVTRRKALQAIPVIGAVVGSSVNGWYIKEVGWAARRAFQERWLIENNRIIDI